MRSVTKIFKFDAAHRLINDYPDNCRHLHGHTYECSVTIELRKMQHMGESQYQETNLDQYGFVFDYNEMKKLKIWIDENLDHATLVAFNDTELRDFLASQEGRNKHYLFENQTSAEIISEHIYKIASEMFDNYRVFVSEVSVNETCSSKSVFRP